MQHIGSYPVSYTHLDVYKRQVFAPVAGLQFPERARWLANENIAELS